MPPLSSLVLWLITASAVAAQDKPRAIAGQVQDAKGQPVAAEVVLRWRTHPELPMLAGYTLGKGGIDEKIVKAKDNGRFRIQPPHRGPFLLVAKHAGSSSTQVFPVAAGDYQILKLEKDHVMGGVVLDDKRKPVAGATVHLLPTNNLMWIRLGLYKQPERRASVTTDANGRFKLHFEHGYLRDPRWNVLMTLQAEHGGYVSVKGSSHWRPTNSSKNVTLRLSQRAGCQIAVTAAGSTKPITAAIVIEPIRPEVVRRADKRGVCEIAALLGDELIVVAPGFRPSVLSGLRNSRGMRHVRLHPGAKMHGKLVGPKGPLAGARVLFDMPRTDKHPVEWQASTDKDGVLSVASIPTGQMVLGFIEIGGRFMKFYEGTPRNNVGLGNMQLNPDVHVHGRVIALDKSPVRGARVALQSVSHGSPSPQRITYTDRAGRFRFDSVFQDHHSVIAAKGEHGQQSVAIGMMDLGKPLRIEMPKGKPIAGKVLRPDGTPASGAWVMIYHSISRNTPAVRAPRTSSTALGTVADASGEFRFDGLTGTSSWTLVAAMMHDGSHCNVSTSASPGKTNLVLRSTVQNR